MLQITRMCLIGCGLAALATPAWAQDDDVPPVSNAPDGQYAVRRGLQGPAGMISARILLDINLSTDHVGKPVSIAPDLYYSATDRLQFGILHQGPMGWQALPGVGLCVTGTDNGCPHLYDNVGFDIMYGLAFDQIHMSLHSSLFLDSFDPVTMSVALGVAAKIHLGHSLALYLDPKIAIAVTERDTNDDAVYVPLELSAQIGKQTTFKLLSGISGGLSTFGDSYQIPFGVGIVRNLTEHFDLGARFSFDNLLGQQPVGVSRTDTRSLAILVNVRS